MTAHAHQALSPSGVTDLETRVRHLREQLIRPEHRMKHGTDTMVHSRDHITGRCEHQHVTGDRTEVIG